MERPRTLYARNGELSIAYQVHGSGDHDLLLSSGTASNLETIWTIPEAADAQGAVAAHGGETIKTTGDGVRALFTGPGQGVRCAEEIVRRARGHGLEVRSGLHTGEVERVRDDVAGLAIHLAARIMGLAEPGEILVSGTVRDLVIGSELSFSERGEQQTKGIPGEWTIYAAD